MREFTDKRLFCILSGATEVSQRSRGDKWRVGTRLVVTAPDVQTHCFDLASQTADIPPFVQPS